MRIFVPIMLEQDTDCHIVTTASSVRLRSGAKMGVYGVTKHAVRQFVQAGMSPAQVADCVFDAIRQDKFYIFTNPKVKDGVRSRMEAILQDRNPTA